MQNISMIRKQKKLVRKVLSYAFLTLLGYVFLYPLLFMLSASFKGTCTDCCHAFGKCDSLQGCCIFKRTCPDRSDCISKYNSINFISE